MKKPSKKELNKLIPIFVKNIGEIPEGNLDIYNIKYIDNNTKEDYKNILKSYIEIGGIDYVKKKYGSWKLALIETNIIEQSSLSEPFGYICRAKDGHVCFSMGEKQIDDWLYINNIKHKKEPKYPYDPIYNKSELKRADWKVGEYYIEYFGLEGINNYNEKIQDKMQIAKRLNLNLISIYYKDLKYLDEKLNLVC